MTSIIIIIGILLAMSAICACILAGKLSRKEEKTK